MRKKLVVSIDISKKIVRGELPSPRPITSNFHRIAENLKRVKRVLTIRFSLILFSVEFLKILKNSNKF